ncbi:Uncharacterized protein HZ326_28748 [Fusarium oxysporum f. sp. albedinis]|nr:Uncharacterized protein HZ326_28748 [Fusarium oxysporum f. sp. albedinis]
MRQLLAISDPHQEPNLKKAVYNLLSMIPPFLDVSFARWIRHVASSLNGADVETLSCPLSRTGFYIYWEMSHGPSIPTFSSDALGSSARAALIVLVIRFG